MRPELKWQYFCRVSVMPGQLLPPPPPAVPPQFIYLSACPSLSLSLSFLFAVVVGVASCPPAWWIEREDVHDPHHHFLWPCVKNKKACSIVRPHIIDSSVALYLPSLFSFSSCQCVKMLAPASNRHAAKVSNDTRWMSGRGGTGSGARGDGGAGRGDRER